MRFREGGKRGGGGGGGDPGKKQNKKKGLRSLPVALMRSGRCPPFPRLPFRSLPFKGPRGAFPSGRHVISFVGICFATSWKDCKGSHTHTLRTLRLPLDHTAVNRVMELYGVGGEEAIGFPRPERFDPSCVNGHRCPCCPMRCLEMTDGTKAFCVTASDHFWDSNFPRKKKPNAGSGSLFSQIF